MTPARRAVTDTELRELVGTPVRHCPSCGRSLDDATGFVHEYWVARDRHFLCWCPSCLFLCTVVLSERITSHEPEH